MIVRNYKQWQASRETRASTYFAILFGTAVITILGVRAVLAITNYPQLGSDTLHIAHMLWGGLFMLVAIIILIYLRGYRAKLMAAFFSGLGLGFFIDELGKFITSNNDYFYQPAAMLIYIFFLALWALLSWLDNYKPVDNRQKYVDMLTRLRDGAVHGLTKRDKSIITAQLNDLGISADTQKQIFKQAAKYSPVYSKKSVNAKTQRFLALMHVKIINIAASRVTKIAIYGVVTVSAMATATLFLISAFGDRGIFDVFGLNADAPKLINYGLLVASGVSTLFIVIGFWYSVRGRHLWRTVLVWYRRAMLVNIFGVQVFLFYINQFAAAFGMIFSLAILYSLTVLIDQIDLQNAKLGAKGKND